MEIPKRKPMKHLISSLVVSYQLFTLFRLAYLFVWMTKSSHSSFVKSLSKKSQGHYQRENQMLVPALGLQTLDTVPRTFHLWASTLSVDLAIQEAIAGIVFELATVVLMFLKC